MTPASDDQFEAGFREAVDLVRNAERERIANWLEHEADQQEGVWQAALLRDAAEKVRVLK